ncbi:MAG: PEP/pyruvate-binding domain-containing protein [Ignavibacteria bacterium]|jgi:phosphoenolpyruvate synthase/pyruvate phosphate dikinase
MNKKIELNGSKFPQFERGFIESPEIFAVFGKGSVGGKGSGLIFVNELLKQKIDHNKYPGIEIGVPKFGVIASDFFDSFMERNNLYEIALSGYSDEIIAGKFIEASLPVEIIGDLREVAEKLHKPLSIRSSSMLEDSKDEPFAGIYATKMIPNNQTSPDERFHKLIDAIKFIYASTFFKAAKDYFSGIESKIENEKMSVIIQDVAGFKHGQRFYPNFSGVARSYNFYPLGKAKPEDGVVSLALGLGKTIVDGGVSWNYSPKFPKKSYPFAGVDDILNNTQTKFWAITLDRIPEYDPVNEIEFLVNPNLSEAEDDCTLNYIASTYNVDSQKINMGIGFPGPRVLNFSQLLCLNEFKFNDLLNELLSVCEEMLENPVEIEFAVNINTENKKAYFSCLQVRPMVVSHEKVEITDKEFSSDRNIISSNKVLGNGTNKTIKNIVFVKPDSFDKKYSSNIPKEIEIINKELLTKKEPYLLIGFGRWGSSDPWLGIPINWGQISGAKVIVESTLPGMNVELSQGSHFFHNLTSFTVLYFSLHHELDNKIDYGWINKNSVVRDLQFVKHVKLNSSLTVKVDGTSGKGIILRNN